MRSPPWPHPAELVGHADAPQDRALACVQAGDPAEVANDIKAAIVVDRRGAGEPVVGLGQIGVASLPDILTGGEIEGAHHILCALMVNDKHLALGHRGSGETTIVQGNAP